MMLPISYITRQTDVPQNYLLRWKGSGIVRKQKGSKRKLWRKQKGSKKGI